MFLAVEITEVIGPHAADTNASKIERFARGLLANTAQYMTRQNERRQCGGRPGEKLTTVHNEKGRALVVRARE